MSKKANPARIGAFVVGALVLVVAGILVFGGGKVFKKYNKFVSFFEGSVKGLNVGSPVVFRGVRVGEVTDIGLQIQAKDLSFIIPVFFEIERGRFEVVGSEGEVPQDEKMYRRLLEMGLRSQLQMQSLVTGQLMIELDFHPGSELKLMGTRERDAIELPSVPTKFQQIAKAIEQVPLDEIVEKVKDVLDGVGKFLGSPQAQEAGTALGGTLEETAKLVQTLNERLNPILDSLEAVLRNSNTLVQHVDAKVDPLADRAVGTLTGTQKLVANLDARVETLGPEIEGAVRDTRSLVQNADRQVAQVAASADGMLTDARTLVQNTDQTVSRLGTSADGLVQDSRSLVQKVDHSAGSVLPAVKDAVVDLRSALSNVDEAVAGIASVVSRDSPVQHDLTVALRELTEASRALKVLVEYLQQYPDALIRGKGR